MGRRTNLAVLAVVVLAGAIAAWLILRKDGGDEASLSGRANEPTVRAPALAGRPVPRETPPAMADPASEAPPAAPPSEARKIDETQFLEGRVVDMQGNGVGGLPIVEDPPSKDWPDVDGAGQKPLAWSASDGRFSFQRPLRVAWLAVGRGKGWIPVTRLWMPLAPSPIVLRVDRARRIRGVVLDLEGRPLPDARVLAYSGERTTGGPDLAGGETGADGRFAFDAPAATSRIRLIALPLLGVPGSESLARADVGPAKRSPDGSADPDDVVLRFGPEAAITGTVVGAAGESVRGAVVTAAADGLPELAAHVARASTKDGSFRVPGLARGPTWLIATTSDGGFDASEPVRTDAPSAGVRLTCPRAFVLHGRLLTDTDAKFIVGWSRRVRGVVRPDFTKWCPVGSDGTFDVGKVSDGDTLVYAYRPGDGRYAWVERVRPDGEDVVLRLQEGGVISGHALAPDGGGISGVEVGVEWNGPHLRFTTGPSGEFTIPGLPKRKYRLLYRFPGPAEVERMWPDEVEAGTTEVRLVIPWADGAPPK